MYKFIYINYTVCIFLLLSLNIYETHQHCMYQEPPCLLLHGIPLYEYTTIFSPTSLRIYTISCFYIGDNMNKAAMNILNDVFLEDVKALRYIL